MNSRSEIERVLDRYLADGAEQVPDRVIDAALDEVDHTPQWRALRVPWRNSSMLNPIRLTVAVGLVAALGIAAFALVPRAQPGLGGPPSPSPQAPSPEPSAQSSSVAAVPLPTTGRVQAGTYRSDLIDPPVTLTWDRALDVHAAEPGMVVTGEAGRARYVVVANAVAVIDPRTGERMPLPDDLVAWLRDHPGLDAGPAQPISIGGLDGQVIEGTLGDAATFDEGRLNLIAVSEETTNSFPILADQAFRIAVLDGPSGPLIVAITPRADLFEDFLPTAEAIVASIRFGE